jgi:hypothetical protein
MTDFYHHIDSFKFTDVMRHWARERLTHEVVIARELAQGIIKEGLRFQSVDPKWTQATDSLRGQPLVGYSTRSQLPILIRPEALTHLQAVASETTDPDALLLRDEFVTKDDFRKWLVHTGRSMPAFWFGVNERSGKPA